MAFKDSKTLMPSSVCQCPFSFHDIQHFSSFQLPTISWQPSWVSEESWWAELFQLLLENAGKPQLEELVKRHLATFGEGFAYCLVVIGVIELLVNQ